MQRTPDDDKRKRRPPKGGTVIHVAFGAHGGRLPFPDPAPQDPRSGDDERSAALREPVTDLFTRREVAKLLRVSETRLRALDRAEIVSPSGQRGGLRAYTFQDLIALRATRELLDRRI